MKIITPVSALARRSNEQNLNWDSQPDPVFARGMLVNT